MKNFLKMTLIFLIMMSGIQFLAAQNPVSPNSFPMEQIENVSATNPKVFSYKETPALCYGMFAKNPFANFSTEQLSILADYDYPLFISHGRKSLERDLSDFKNAKKEWNTSNQHRKEEILTSLGLSE